jgi:hypothetical protein
MQTMYKYSIAEVLARGKGELGIRNWKLEA